MTHPNRMVWIMTTQEVMKLVLQALPQGYPVSLSTLTKEVKRKQPKLTKKEIVAAIVLAEAKSRLTRACAGMVITKV